MIFNPKKLIKTFIHSKRRRLSRHLFAEALLSKKGLEFRANEIEILGVGSSHCKRSFDTDMIKNAFNFGIVGQDLYSTHWILDQYLDKLPKLRKVVAFYSIHSQGHEMAKTNDIKGTVISHYVFGVPYYANYLKKWEKAAKHRFKKFNDSDIDYTTFSGFVLEDNQNKIVAPWSTESRCAGHLRNNQRFIKQNHHLYELAEKCKEHGVKFFVAIAPARSDYLAELDKAKIPDSVLFHDLYKWAKANDIPILNELRSKDYEWDDFSDTDHLEPIGAKKFTKKLAQFIDEPLK